MARSRKHKRNTVVAWYWNNKRRLARLIGGQDTNYIYNLAQLDDLLQANGVAAEDVVSTTDAIWAAMGYASADAFADDLYDGNGILKADIVAAIPTGYSPVSVSFGAGVYTDDLALTEGNDIVFAARVKNTVANGLGNIVIASGTLTNSAIYIADGNNEKVTARVENTSGSSGSMSSTTEVPQTVTASIFVRCSLIDAATASYELWVDGVLEASLTGPVADPAIRDIKQLSYLNSSNGSGGDSLGFDLIGGMWISNTGYSALSYSDFFNGSNEPIFNSDVINGVTARFFQNGNAAAWNSGANDGADGGFTMTGSVTDI